MVAQLISSPTLLQVHLAELLEKAGADIIQTEGGVSSAPTQAGVAGMIEKVCYISVVVCFRLLDPT